MAFIYNDLTETTRQKMLEEVAFDENRDALYFSKRFNEEGIERYPELLKNSLSNGNEDTLADNLNSYSCFKEKEERKTNTGTKLVKVPVTAANTFAEGEFNRFYIRALCIIALKENKTLTIYRARHSNNPRPESEDLIGKEVEAEKLLEDLRNNIGVDTALGLPSGPNSGLSVKLS